MKRWTLDEERGDIIYEVVGDNLVLKIKPEFIAGIKTPVSGGGGGEGGVGIYHIKLNDLVAPTDENAFTALRTLKEIDNALTDYIVDIDAMYLRKDIDDTAHGNILFDKLIGSTAYIDGFDGKGWRILADGSAELEGIRARSDIFLGGKVGSPSFASGFTGWGWEIDTPTASGTVDNWTVRKSMKVYELVYSQIYGLSGSTLVTDFNKIKEVTPLGTNRYHCTLDDVDGTMFMNLRDGDIVRLQKRDGWNIRYYYAEVENVAMESFDLKVIDGTDTPEPGDVAFRMGSKTDKNRQGLIYLTSSDDYAAYIDILDGVTDHRFTQENTKVRLGNLRGIRVNGQPLDMHGIYINGGVFQHSKYYLDDGTTIEQQFSIMDGKLESLIGGIRDDISGEKGNVLRNPAFATSLNYWERTGNVHFIPVEGGFLYVPYSFYADKESVADLYKEGSRKMLRLRACSVRQFNSYMSLPKHPSLTLPSLPGTEPSPEGTEMTQFSYSFSFHYRVLRPGRLTAGIEGSALWVDEELQPSDAFTLCFKEGLWDEKGDFIISFTGEILIYGATLRNDAEADNFLRFETGIEQTLEQIRLWATKEMKDQEGKLTTLFQSQLTITAEQISGISTKVDNINHTIETAGWITRAEGNQWWASQSSLNGLNSQFSSLEQTVDGIFTSVGEISGRVDNAEDAAEAARQLAERASSVGLYSQEQYSQTSDPWDKWRTGQEFKHVGALWYNPDTGKTKRYVGINGNRLWEDVSDSDISAASFVLQGKDKWQMIVANFDSKGKPTEESGILTTAKGTTLYASKRMENGADIVSAINLSPEEVKIQAKNIKLEGLVTANSNFKILTDGSIEAMNGKFNGTLVARDVKGSNLIGFSHLIKVTISGSSVTSKTLIGGSTPIFGGSLTSWGISTVNGQKIVYPSSILSYSYYDLYPIVFGVPNMSDSKHLYVSVLPNFSHGASYTYPWAFTLSDDSTYNDGSFYVLWVTLPKQ